ncbi:MAG: 2TM domain-containing protein [Acidimicrobiales bacterium]
MADDEQRRAAAIERLKEKRSFSQDVVAYVVVNAFLVFIWAITGRGYFWPAWIMGAWGIGLVMHAWTVFGQRPITESEIQQEMQRDEK